MPRSSGSRYSNVARAHERTATTEVGAWTPEFSGTSLRFCDPNNPGNCTAWVDLKGDAGPAGSQALSYSATAGETLGGNRAVYADDTGKVYLAEAGDDTAERVVGITTHSATVGQAIEVQISGEMVEPSWSWDTTKAVYLSTSGQLTQTPPSNGWSVEIGQPRSATALIIRIQHTIELES